MVKLSAQQSTLARTKADILACFLFEDPPLLKRQKKRLSDSMKKIESQLDVCGFRGRIGETSVLYPKQAAAKRLLLVGLGKSGEFSMERIRRTAAIAAKTAQAQGGESLALFEPDIEGVPTLVEHTDIQKDIGLALGEGAALGLYTFDKYLSRTGEKQERHRLKQVTVIGQSSNHAVSLGRGVKLARVVCEATYLARDLANAPGNEIDPDSLARRASSIGREHGISVTIFDEKRIRQLNMGGLIGVSQGSDKPPRFIVMEYNAKSRTLPTIVLVGKGVTFDSGGISIKPAANMAEMKMDMSGAAAVIATLQATAVLKLPVRVIGLVPATENLPGGSALKPGDILKHYNGKTSEIDNTDAEGRLILADALSFAERYTPDIVIDLATLTGACVVALGHVATGMMGNDQPLMDKLRAAGERTYERVWQLPLFEEYGKLIKSDVADVKNTGGRWGGAITAAFFLKNFIGNYKWIHLDIAGTAIYEEASDYIPKGGSGVGVRLLIDFLRHWGRTESEMRK